VHVMMRIRALLGTSISGITTIPSAGPKCGVLYEGVMSPKLGAVQLFACSAVPAFVFVYDSRLQYLLSDNVERSRGTA